MFPLPLFLIVWHLMNIRNLTRLHWVHRNFLRAAARDVTWEWQWLKQRLSKWYPIRTPQFLYQCCNEFTLVHNLRIYQDIEWAVNLTKYSSQCRCQNWGTLLPTIPGVWRLEGRVELSPAESNWRLVFVSTLTDSEPGAGAATAEQLSRNYEGSHTFTLNI